jgi:hypothetical protein
MSYSFTVAADTKDEAIRRIREKFDAIVKAQPSHASDREAAVVAAQTLVRLLAEPAEDDEVYVIMNGSLSWNADAPNEFLNAGLGVNVMLRKKSSGE